MSAIQADIETQLAQVEPDVEVLLAEVVGGRLVRLYIDHPKGVSLELCERVTTHLPAVRDRYALEVSSPGPERPLSKPDHFRRFVGRRARVRTRGALPDGRTARHRRAARRHRRRGHRRRRRRRGVHRLRRHQPIEPRRGLSHVTGDR